MSTLPYLRGSCTATLPTSWQSARQRSTTIQAMGIEQERACRGQLSRIGEAASFCPFPEPGQTAATYAALHPGCTDEIARLREAEAVYEQGRRCHLAQLLADVFPGVSTTAQIAAFQQSTGCVSVPYPAPSTAQQWMCSDAAAEAGITADSTPEQVQQFIRDQFARGYWCRGSFVGSVPPPEEEMPEWFLPVVGGVGAAAVVAGVWWWMLRK